MNEDPYVSGVCLLEQITTKCCMQLIANQHFWLRCPSIKTNYIKKTPSKILNNYEKNHRNEAK